TKFFRLATSTLSNPPPLSNQGDGPNSNRRKTHHLAQAPTGNDISRMHQTVKMPCTLVDLFPHFILAIHIKNIRHKIQRMVVVENFVLQAREVEAVRQILFVNLAEVFVATGRKE